MASSYRPRPIGRRDSSLGILSTREKTFILAVLVALGLLGSWSAAAALQMSPGITIVVFLMLGLSLLALGSGAGVAWRRWSGERQQGQPPKGLATQKDVKAQDGVQRARSKAKFQRASMTPAEVDSAPIDELALFLGKVKDHPIYAPLEEQGVVLGKTGSGKGAYYVVPATLSPPGPVVVTTTRPDVIDVIATRRKSVGRFWVFDPLNLANWPEPMVWDCLTGCERDSVARARGRAFVAALGKDGSGGNTEFFKDTSGAAIQYMVHAAALGRADNLGDFSMADVCTWAMQLDNGGQFPQQLIRGSRHPRAEHLWADMLNAVATGADDTVASTRVTLRGALDAISSGSVLDCVVPREGIRRFDPRQFVTSSDTLVLVADANSLTNVAPLTTMLFQEIIDVGKEVARTMPNNLLDPPLRVVGDEIANVAPVENLPELMTDSRGYGFELLLFFQSVAQIVAKWGRDRAQNLLAQAGFEIVLPGLKDQESADRYSYLVGSVDVAESTVSTSAEGDRQGASLSMRDHRALRPEEVRKLFGEGSALLIPALGEAMILQLEPWWERPGGHQLSEEGKKVSALRAAQAAAKLRKEKEWAP